MRQIHATTGHPSTYLRMVGIMATSGIGCLLVPHFPSEYENFFSFHAINVGVLFAIILGFIMSLSLTRKHELEEFVLLELNKIRRIYHIAFHLRLVNPALSSWFVQIRAHLFAYLERFEGMDFEDYRKGSPLFRKLTYQVYALPAEGEAYNEELYASLLEATSSATEAREQIAAKKDNDIGYFQWFVIVFVALIFSLIIITGTPYELTQRFVTGIVVFAIFLSLQLVYEYDRSNALKRRLLSDLYVKNLESIRLNEAPKRQSRAR